MGLDMYLTKKTYVQKWDHHAAEDTYVVEVTKGGQPANHIQPSRVTHIEEQIGYWRKANAIHKWFVDNVSDGEDNCGTYSVEIDDLINLLELCKQVKNEPSRAETLLPTQSGFFFGDVEYDELYMKDIDHTINVIETALSESSFDKNGREFYSADFYYHASW